MGWPVYFPNVKTKSTKDLILRLLTENKSMTNQVIFNSIKKKYGVSIAYQSVRQALVELVDAKVLDKNGREYFISKKWIEVLFSYASILRDKYLNNKKVEFIDENTHKIHLDSLYDMGHFVLYGFKDHFFDLNQSNELYMVLQHLWFPFFNKEKRELLVDFFKVNKNYVYVANKGVLNRILSIYYKQYCKVKLGVKIDKFFDIIVHGDCVAKIHMPNELRRKMDKIYRSRNPLNVNVIHDFSELAYYKYPINMIITRDEIMAREIKEKLKEI